MKKVIISGIGLFMTICLAMSTTQVSAQKSDEAAIKKVINQETSDFFHKNYDAWITNWAQDTAASVLNIGPAGVRRLNGWNAISAQYKTIIQNLRPRTNEEFASILNRTDFHIYINGNMATVSFKEGKTNPNTELRTLVKQNGAWKILSLTMINDDRYDMTYIMNTMKAFVGKWVMDGTPTVDTSNPGQMNSAEFVLWETPNGLEQTSKFMVTNDKGVTNAIPTDYEYFIPDYNTNKIFYLSVEKNHFGQTFTGEGIITSDKMNSFTVTTTYPDKPDQIETEYTVTMQNGKWHQVGKNYDRNGKVVRTETMDMRRL